MCPYGLHACSRCGQKGHGREDCRQVQKPPVPSAAPHLAEMVPPLPPPPPPPPPRPTVSVQSTLVVACTSKCRGSAGPRNDAEFRTKEKKDLQPKLPEDHAPSEPNDAFFVPGFGYKGCGKGANYGVEIPPPTTVSAGDPHLFPAQSSSASDGFELLPTGPQYPPPIPVTPEEVAEWMSTGFRPLSQMSTKMPPEIGESVLWRGVKHGRSGQPSTNVEYFNGKVRHISVENETELYLYVD